MRFCKIGPIIVCWVGSVDGGLNKLPGWVWGGTLSASDFGACLASKTMFLTLKMGQLSVIQSHDILPCTLEDKVTDASAVPNG